MEDSGGGSMWEQKEHMFDVVLTPSDIGKQLWIEEENFKWFRTTGLNLPFVDSTGKTWKFSPCIFKESKFCLSNDWEEFIVHTGLRAGDVVSFWRARDMNKGNDEDVFFVNYEKKHSPLAKEKLCRSKDCGIIALDGSDFCDVHSVWGKSGHRDIPSSMVPVKENSRRKAESSSMIIKAATSHPALLYCTIFPENYEFEKDTIIQLWLAGGLFREELESWAQYSEAVHFFAQFQALHFIQPSRTVSASGGMFYKFDKRKLSELSPSYTCIMIDNKFNLNDLSADISHVAVRCSSFMDSTALGRFKIFKKLQSLLFIQGQQSSFRQIPRNLFLSLSKLQALDLSQTHISELPNTIASLKLLRYLDLSQTGIKRLPEIIDRLTNLQTLKLKGCPGLSILPKGMRKLVSLNHLDIDVLRQLHTMPQGMGSLTNLQTLSAFHVGTEDECGIGQLKRMDSLRGRFCISRLENVLTLEEAMKARLCNKFKIIELELLWSDSRDEGNVDEKILSCLLPNSNLQELRLVSYGGLKLPSWICDSMFYMLVCITFFNFENCLVLPSLGQLPSLKFLNIIDFPKLKVIDLDFNGGDGIEEFIAFPKLEKLYIENMYSLEEWTGIQYFHYLSLLKLTVKNCPKLHTLYSLSCLCALEDLEISQCSVLAPCLDEKLPDSVRTFIIKDCPIISASILREGSPDWNKVAHVPSLWIDHQEISHDIGSKQAATGKADSPVTSFSASSNIPGKEFKYLDKRNNPLTRLVSQFTKKVEVIQGSSKKVQGLDEPINDGYSWRKYGEKAIVGDSYPRSYYRCAYKQVQGCQACRQVQRSDDDPTVFDVTYYGMHTCILQNSMPSSLAKDLQTPPGVIRNSSSDQGHFMPTTMESNLVSHQQQDDNVFTNISVDKSTPRLPGDNSVEKLATTPQVDDLEIECILEGDPSPAPSSRHLSIDLNEKYSPGN